MTYLEIENFMTVKNNKGLPVKINFKVRPAIKGLFIKTRDYDELSRKNLWRIVSETNLDAYYQSNDINLGRIFNGTEMTRLETL
jgi:hypothetical protein